MDQPVEQAERPGTIAIPRVTFNYVMIAFTFLILGLVLGAIGYDRFAQANAAMVEQSVVRALTSSSSDVQGLIDRAVAAALDGGSAGDTARLDPSERYDIPVDGNPSLGPEDAPVTIVEFSDFRCSYCGRFARETLRPLLAEYEDQVRFVYRDYIIFGQPSYEASLAAACADNQGAFWPFHDAIFENQQGLNRDFYLSVAEAQDLDIDEFTQCMDDEEPRDPITQDVVFGQSMGISGTPAFFINGRVVSGAQPIEVFRSIIEAELAELGATS